uniref:Uncharacterized protein n=1 Tax=Dendroctonus ponderosae TaxID=77166 RepID=A0AAR5QI70_DENPD
MDLKTAETTGCNCNCSLGVLRGTSTHIGASLIIECVIIGVLLILIGCVVYLFYWGSKLAKLVKALDPVGTYKRVGPSIYVKKPQRDNASISSSFQHFNGSPVVEESYANGSTLNANRTKDTGGTLDRNFFTSTNFSFQNSLSDWNDREEKNSTSTNSKRRTTEEDAMEAITKIDNVLY